MDHLLERVPNTQPKNQINSIMLHGAAGSGKSTVARKIEEDIWEQFDSFEEDEDDEYIQIN